MSDRLHEDGFEPRWHEWVIIGAGFLPPPHLKGPGLYPRWIPVGIVSL
jgi:hypothetical protein